jgi:hypothetical protein
MRIAILTLLLAGVIPITKGQSQYWKKAYDRNGNTDMMSKIIETSNHHFIITGSTTIPANYAFGFDGYVIATDFNGDTLWTKTIGSMGWGAQNDFLNDVIEDQSKNLIFTGITKQGLQDKKLWFVKFQLNANGTQVLSVTEKKYGTTESGGAKIIQNPDGTYFIVGFTTSMGTQQGGSDVWLLKLNNNGDTIWTKTYDFGYRDEGTGIVPLSGGNFLLIANLYTGQISFPVPYYTSDAAYLLVDGNGNMIKSLTFNADTINRFTDIRPTNDGGAIIAGHTSRYENGLGASDVCVVKLNSNADTVWTKTYGGYGKYDGGLGVTQANDGTYYVTAFTQTQYVDSVDNWWLLRLNALGDTIYTKCLIHKKDNDDPASIIQASDGSFVIAGWINANSNPAQGLNMGNSDIYVIKGDSLGNVTKVENILQKPDISINIYPNPFSSQTVLRTDAPLHNATLTVVNCFGQTVKQIKNISGQTVTLFRDNLKSGLYFIRLTQDSKVITADKLVITD